MARPPEPQPGPPPEALLLKRARLRHRSRLSLAAAAALAGVSPSLWRQVEAGYSTPAAGVRVRKVAPADTLAVMSRPLGLTPADLAAAGRDDAAAELAGLLAGPAAARGGAESSAGSGRPRPGDPAPRREHALADDPDLEPFIAGVREDLGSAMARFGPGFGGRQAFSVPHEAETWDDPDALMPDDSDRVRLIARNRRRATEWQSEERRIGL
jgi:Helix-turn-helix domain